MSPTPLPSAACTTGLNHPLHLLLSLIFWPCYSLKFTLDSFSSSPSWFMPSFLVTVGGKCMNYFLSLSGPSLPSVTCSSAPSRPVMPIVSAVTHHTWNLKISHSLLRLPPAFIQFSISGTHFARILLLQWNIKPLTLLFTLPTYICVLSPL